MTSLPTTGEAPRPLARSALPRCCAGRVRGQRLISPRLCICAHTHSVFKEVPTYKFISVSVLIDRMKINGSLARKAVRTLEKEGCVSRTRISYQAAQALED